MFVDMFTVHISMLSLFLDPWDAAQWAVTCGNVKRVAAEYHVGGVPEVFGLVQILRGLLHQTTAAIETFRTVLFLRDLSFRRARLQDTQANLALYTKS